MDTLARPPDLRIDDGDAFASAVEAALLASHPLGAYATASEVRYVFLDERGPFALSSPRFAGSEERTFASVAARRPLFGWDEREMADERAVLFRDLPDARPLRARGGRMPEAVVDRRAGLVRFVVGPVHAGIIEPGRFTFSSGGETIVHLDAQLGYAHRGVERQLEGRDALAAAPAIGRICGSCSAARSAAYARALERLADVRPREDAELARLVILELERVYNHLGDLAAAASAAGWAPGFIAGLGLKEEAMRLCALASGHRLLFDAIVPGGTGPNVLLDPANVRAGRDRIEGRVERYLQRLFSNASLVSRWRSAGVVAPHATHALGAVGPAGRASGTGLDVRAHAPYGAYLDHPVRPAHGREGDVFARCCVKADELRESLRLLKAALARAGAAPAPPPPVRASAGIAHASVEGPRGAETVAVELDEAGRLTRLHAISASHRNWPVVVRAMAGNIVPDFPLVNKSFNLCYACADR